MNYEMKANTKGELAYMKKANSVAEKYTYYNSDGGEINVPIPKKYQKLVQSGAYHIEDMDTSTDEGKALAEAISEYQSWYEKAQDCKQAVIDLRNEQQKLFEQWANMPTEKAEKKIDRLTTGYNGINAVSSRLTAATKGGSTQAVLAQTMKEDLAEAQDQKKSDNKALKSAKTANKKASSEKRKADNKVKSTATQKNMPDYAGMAKAIEKNIQNIQNLSGNTYVNNFYIDGAQDTESILREIDKHLDKKIQAHDKKQVRDFKSLR